MQKTFVLIVHIINQMGQTIFELYDRVKAFDLQAELDKVIEASEAEIVDANTEMLYSGIDSEGKSLGQYADRTIEYKKKKNQPYDRITLKDEGDYYSGKKLVKNNSKYTVISSDYKNAKLETDFGIGINGVDESRMAILTDDKFSPGITKAFQDIL